MQSETISLNMPSAQRAAGTYRYAVPTTSNSTSSSSSKHGAKSGSMRLKLAKSVTASSAPKGARKR